MRMPINNSNSLVSHCQPFNDLSNLLLQRCCERIFARFQRRTVYVFPNTCFPKNTDIPPLLQLSILRCLTRNPQNLTARSVLCECYYRQGKYEQALAVGEAGFEYGTHHTISGDLSENTYAGGEYGRVVTYCREVLTKRIGRTDYVSVIGHSVCP